jgi:hypothetical protein
MKEFTWTVCFYADDAVSYGACRQFASVHLLLAEGMVWLAGKPPEPALASLLAKLPCVARYQVLAGGFLVEPGRQVPVRQLPAGAWQPLRTFLWPQMPAAAVPGRLTAHLAVTLVPATQPLEPAALRTMLADWKAYVRSAPECRLAPLRFAVSEHGEVLVVGKPLPPMPGELLVNAGSDVLLPAGWALAEGLTGEVICGKMSLQAGDLAVFRRDGSWNLIAKSCLLPVQRSGVALTEVAR